ncbi:SOS response-associated peptidase [Sphingomonas limnosediminicola]|uniref:Abasic site processing protein n=2 Tax=Sphingomonas limnosediminicola TaxID=940133 RepID=A0ABP7KWU9_9SPHN
MCNEYQRYVPLGIISEQFSQIRIPLRFPEGLPNLAPTSIRIGEVGTIVRPSSSEPGAVELVQRPWSWRGPTGKPVFNFRSEGREFKRGRCLIVADGFFEFTDDPDAQAKRAKKKKWLFTKNDEPWFCIAGLWRTDDKSGEAYTMLTTSPGPDVAPYHDRQVAVLHREQWPVWLDEAKSVKGLIGPLPAGTLSTAAV